MPDGVFTSVCYTCKCEMWLPQALYDAAQHAKGVITFYCAYGHGQVFAKGETDLDKMRRERDRLYQEMAYKDDLLKEIGRKLDASQDMLRREKAAATKAKKRSAAGTCPCCHRTFRQMALHMANKHPTFKAEKAV